MNIGNLNPIEQSGQLFGYYDYWLNTEGLLEQDIQTIVDNLTEVIEHLKLGLG